MYELVVEQDYPEAISFVGKAEVGEGEFQGPPEQLLPVALVGFMASGIVQTVYNNGGRMMQLRIWADKSPTFYTRYKVRVVLHASPFAWAAVVAAIIILGLLAITAWKTSEIDWGKAALPIGLGAAALILLVLVLAFVGR